MSKDWRFIKKEKIFEDRILDISHHHWEFTKRGVKAPFTSIDTSNWVVIVPVLENGNIVLVRQFRPIVEEYTLEFPGGALHTGEDADDAALRELEEETGLLCKRCILLGTLRPNPAIMSNRCFVYLADGCFFGGKTSFDPFEDITIEEMTKEELKYRVKCGDINHSVVLGAYALYVTNIC
ncbi:MAG: NUDIX hydrolase [Calditerrivibrio sp.]|nr:NUDIX hydrolase [Calditerrivibrio sp.]